MKCKFPLQFWMLYLVQYEMHMNEMLNYHQMLTNAKSAAILYEVKLEFDKFFFSEFVIQLMLTVLQIIPESF